MSEKNVNKKGLSRRDFLRSLAAGGAGATLVTVGVPMVSASSKGGLVKETVVGQDQVVVTVFINGNLLTEADAIQEATMFTIHLQEYNLQDTNVIARYEGQARTDYLTKVRLLTASGEIDNTVVWSGFAGIDGFAIDGILEPLDDLMANAGISLDEWIEPVQGFIRYDVDNLTWGAGPTWGLPLWAHAGFAFVIYNEDVLNAAGAPIPEEGMTWQEIIEIAEQVRDEADGIWGIAWNPYGNRHDINVELLYVAPFGGYSLNEEGTECLLNSPEGIEAYAFYNEMVNERQLSPRAADHEAFGGYTGGAEAGALPMYRMGGWGANWFLQREENVNPKMGLIVAPDTFDGRPGGRRGNTMGIDWYGVSANASNPDAVFDVLYWITNEEAGKFQVDSGNTNPAPRHDVLDYEGLENNPVAQKNAAALPGVDFLPRPANARTSEINELIQQRFTAVDTGEAEANQEWVDALTAEIQAILDQPPLEG